VELIIARRYVTRIAPLTIRYASFKIAFMFLWAGPGGGPEVKSSARDIGVLIRCADQTTKSGEVEVG
jgi:hypothetical protein